MRRRKIRRKESGKEQEREGEGCKRRKRERI